MKQLKQIAYKVLHIIILAVES